jgi:hypothetical protein
LLHDLPRSPTCCNSLAQVKPVPIAVVAGVNAREGIQQRAAPFRLPPPSRARGRRNPTCSVRFCFPFPRLRGKVPKADGGIRATDSQPICDWRVGDAIQSATFVSVFHSPPAAERCRLQAPGAPANSGAGPKGEREDVASHADGAIHATDPSTHLRRDRAGDAGADSFAAQIRNNASDYTSVSSNLD